MGFDYLLYETKGAIAIVTLNRPKALNALCAPLMKELKACLKEIGDDPGVAGVILTGSGEKAFAAGADIKEMAEMTAEEGMRHALFLQDVLFFLEQFGKPVIAAVNGFCLGAGNELAMACHWRVASEKARFGQPEVTLGLIPGAMGSQRLPRLIGKGNAMEWICTGNMYGAQDALRVGLVNKVTPPDELLETCEKMISDVAKRSPIAVEYGIKAINQGEELSTLQAGQVEANLFGLCFATQDMQEGTQAFIEKRKPDFQGH